MSLRHFQCFFSWFPEQNRAQHHSLCLLGCGLGPLRILLQASGDFLSFLFSECSPCLWHPSYVSFLDSVPGTAHWSAFSSMVFWELLCYWWLCIPGCGAMGAALLLVVASCPRLTLCTVEMAQITFSWSSGPVWTKEMSIWAIHSKKHNSNCLRGKAHC